MTTVVESGLHTERVLSDLQRFNLTQINDLCISQKHQQQHVVCEYGDSSGCSNDKREADGWTIFPGGLFVYQTRADRIPHRKLTYLLGRQQAGY